MTTKLDKDLTVRADDPAKLVGGDLRGEVFLYIVRRNSLLGSVWRQYEAVMVGTTLQLHESGTLDPDLTHLYDEYPEPARTISLAATNTDELPKAKLRKLQGDKRWVFMIEDRASGKPPVVLAVRRQEARDDWIRALAQRGAHVPEAEFIYEHMKTSAVPKTTLLLLSGLFDKISAQRNMSGAILTADVFMLAAHLGYEMTPGERERMAEGRVQFSKQDLLHWWDENIPQISTPKEQLGWDDSTLPYDEGPVRDQTSDSDERSDEPPSTGRVDNLVSTINEDTENWNDIYQRVLDLKLGRYRSTMLSKFLNAFLLVAFSRARKIICELALPDHDKTLMCLPEEAKEEAFTYEDQGRTYVNAGMIFRVADNGQRDGPHVANQVLSKLVAVNWQTSSALRDTAGLDVLRPVLSCVVDYLGVRVFVSAIAPLDGDKVIFDGSAAAHLRIAELPGEVFQGIEQIDKSKLNEQLELFAVGDRPLLHTKPYSATFLLPMASPNKGPAAPGTLEASMCRSLVIHKPQRYYMLPTASMLPPETPTSTSQLELLTRRLRRELVVSYSPKKEELSEGVQMPSDESIAAATADRVLTEQAVGLAAALDELTVFVYDSSSLSAAMHNFGLNMRHLGRLFAQCTAPHIRALIRNECIARACKHLHRQLLRRVLFGGSSEVKFSAHEAATLASVDFVNTIIGQSFASDAFWKDVLPPKIAELYGEDLARSLRRFQVHMPQLLEALQYHCSIEVHVTMIETRFDAPKPLEAGQLVLTVKLKDIATLRGESAETIAHEKARTGQYAEAMAMLERAKDENALLFANTGLLSRRRHGMTLFKLAQASARSGQIDQAVYHAMNAMEALPALSALAVRVSILIGRLQMQRKDFASALDACSKARDICIWALGEHHVLLLHTLAATADVLYAQATAAAASLHKGMGMHGGIQEQSDASKIADEAFAAAIKLLGVQHSLTVALAYKAAVIKFDMDEVANARDILESGEPRSVIAAVRARPPDQVGADCLQLLASTYARQLKLPKAYSLAQESLKMRLSLATTQRRELASCFRANAVISQKMVGQEGASHLHSESVEVLEPDRPVEPLPPAPAETRKKAPVTTKPAPWAAGSAN